ncbi:hypothetical protein [Frankia tisae]|uniref:hypothetical protein n=1 Tax=Frankia tisae TaxID=2950104 RepID=UPI0021BECE68|nr:hypothetical protein [Frankia tisae]
MTIRDAEDGSVHTSPPPAPRRPRRRTALARQVRPYGALTAVVLGVGLVVAVAGLLTGGDSTPAAPRALVTGDAALAIDRAKRPHRHYDLVVLVGDPAPANPAQGRGANAMVRLAVTPEQARALRSAPGGVLLAAGSPRSVADALPPSFAVDGTDRPGGGATAAAIRQLRPASVHAAGDESRTRRALRWVLLYALGVALVPLARLGLATARESGRPRPPGQRGTPPDQEPVDRRPDRQDPQDGQDERWVPSRGDNPVGTRIPGWRPDHAEDPEHSASPVRVEDQGRLQGTGRVKDRVEARELDRPHEWDGERTRKGRAAGEEVGGHPPLRPLAPVDRGWRLLDDPICPYCSTDHAIIADYYCDHCDQEWTIEPGEPWPDLLVDPTAPVPVPAPVADIRPPGRHLDGP